ncbi:hypothetical protein FRC00_006846 [Tulasnella sp. 408]|nr:hypothetical protein FRC00_006846 [Tulasnella sp. 408]
MLEEYDFPAWLDASSATALPTDANASNPDPSPTFNTYRQTRAPFPSTLVVPGRTNVNGEVAEVEGYGLITAVSISHDQGSRLGPGKWLTCSLVDLYAYEVANVFFESNPHRAGDLCLIPSAMWFHLVEGRGRVSTGRQDSTISPLQYKYVAIPANGRGDHYFLCIITHASDLLAANSLSGPARTAILILDSLGTGYETPDLDLKTKALLLKLSSGHKVRQSALKALKPIRVPVPSQKNGYDCGLYPGHFLSVFLSDPERYTEHCLGRKLIEGSRDSVWEVDRISTAREALSSLVEMATRYRTAAASFDSRSTPYPTKYLLDQAID